MMVLQPNDVQGGDILIGHNLLITPALLLDNKLKLDEGRLLDFCTFVNALILHDRLITLPAEIPEHLVESALYKYLKDKGILHELNFDYSRFGQQEKFEMRDLLGEAFPPEQADLVLGQLKERMNSEYYLGSYYLGGHNEYYVNTPAQEDSINFQRSRFIDEVINVRKEDWNRGIPANSALGYSADLQLHRLRTAAYWEVSGMLSMAFLPDFMRIPIISGYGSSLRQSLRYFIQRSADRLELEPELKNELKTALIVASSMIIPVPAAVLNFLNRCSTSSAVEAFEGLRDEFNEQKKAIVTWEGRMRKTDKKGSVEALKVMSEIEESLKSLGGTNLTETAVSVAPGILEDAVRGTFGFSSVGSLVKEGVDLIQRWRRRARMSYLYSSKKEAASIGNQDELLRKVFGTHLTPRQVGRFISLSNSLDRLTYS